jgi:hypothetical protein
VTDFFLFAVLRGKDNENTTSTQKVKYTPLQKRIIQQNMKDLNELLEKSKLILSTFLFSFSILTF